MSTTDDILFLLEDPQAVNHNDLFINILDWVNAQYPKPPLVPPPFRTWQQFFENPVRDDWKLLILERWYATIRGQAIAPEPRYNDYFDTEMEARTAWAVWRILAKRPDDVFPGDRMPKDYEGRGNGLSLFRPATDS